MTSLILVITTLIVLILLIVNLNCNIFTEATVNNSTSNTTSKPGTSSLVASTSPLQAPPAITPPSSNHLPDRVLSQPKEAPAGGTPIPSPQSEPSSLPDSKATNQHPHPHPHPNHPDLQASVVPNLPPSARSVNNNANAGDLGDLSSSAKQDNSANDIAKQPIVLAKTKTAIEQRTNSDKNNSNSNNNITGGGGIESNSLSSSDSTSNTTSTTTALQMDGSTGGGGGGSPAQNGSATATNGETSDKAREEPCPETAQLNRTVGYGEATKYFDIDYASKTFEVSMVDKNAIQLHSYINGFKELMK